MQRRLRTDNVTIQGALWGRMCWLWYCSFLSFTWCVHFFRATFDNTPGSYQGFIEETSSDIIIGPSVGAALHFPGIEKTQKHTRHSTLKTVVTKSALQARKSNCVPFSLLQKSFSLPARICTKSPKINIFRAHPRKSDLCTSSLRQVHWRRSNKPVAWEKPDQSGDVKWWRCTGTFCCSGVSRSRMNQPDVFCLPQHNERSIKRSRITHVRLMSSPR